MELADTSAWTTRRRDGVVGAAFEDLLVRKELATCDMVEAELLWTARSAGEFDALRLRFTGLERVRIDSRHWDRALDVWARLARRGRLRQVKHPDLLIAAVGELEGLPVLHYDRHFELIAEVTGQPLRALAPLGSLG